MQIFSIRVAIDLPNLHIFNKSKQAALERKIREQFVPIV
jgi:hypothetical protein